MTPRFKRHTLLAAIAACLLMLASAAGAAAKPSQTGGAAFVPPPPPPKKAKIWNGKAIAPRGAPARVKRMIAAGNRLIGKPYRYGGGHRSLGRALDSGYVCSGTVSYALFGGRFLKTPLDSTGFMSWGRSGPGRWITVYAHGGHAYVVVAGLRLDTGLRDPDAPTTSGPAWSKRLRTTGGFVARHPAGF